MNKKQNEKDLKIMFDNKDKETCSICGKKSLPEFYKACCDRHRILNCKRFMDSCERIVKQISKVKVI